MCILLFFVIDAHKDLPSFRVGGGGGKEEDLCVSLKK